MNGIFKKKKKEEETSFSQGKANWLLLNSALGNYMYLSVANLETLLKLSVFGIIYLVQ